MSDIARPQTFSGRRASQVAEELQAFIALLAAAGVRRYLEIGARDGDTFHAVMSSLGRGAVGVAVDLPGGAWGKPSTRERLIAATNDLNRAGIAAVPVFGDSQGEWMRGMVRDLGPRYDAVLIDADHRYGAVAKDFEAYGHCAPVVAFHDIVGDGQSSRDGMPIEVPILWAELKQRFAFDEFVAPGSRMGIGVVYPQGRPTVPA